MNIDTTPAGRHRSLADRMLAALTALEGVYEADLPVSTEQRRFFRTAAAACIVELENTIKLVVDLYGDGPDNFVPGG